MERKRKINPAHSSPPLLWKMAAAPEHRRGERTEPPLAPLLTPRPRLCIARGGFSSPALGARHAQKIAGRPEGYRAPFQVPTRPSPPNIEGKKCISLVISQGTFPLPFVPMPQTRFLHSSTAANRGTLRVLEGCRGMASANHGLPPE